MPSLALFAVVECKFVNDGNCGKAQWFAGELPTIEATFAKNESPRITLAEAAKSHRQNL
jgi:hypothetical protein